MELAKISASQTMSSLEIAELTGKEHKEVLRDLRKILKEAEIDAAQFCAPQTYGNNNTRDVYNLPRRECDLVVSGYSVKYRLAIIDRWQKLEAMQAPKLPTDYITALEALLISKKAEAELTEQLAIAAPKVAVYEILADRKQDVSTTIIAKQLGTSAIKLNQFLRDKGVKWLNADLPKAGYMEWFNIVSDVKNGHEFQQCMVTPLGQLQIAELWEKNLAR